MREEVLKTRGIFLLCAVLAAILLAAGCGSSSGDSEVEVKTGSLSKAEFIAKADAICKAARTEFLAEYRSFLETHKAEATEPKKQEEFLSDVLETVLGPNVEGQIEQISNLGAPASYAPEAKAFLVELQQRLDEAHEDPAGLTSTPTPFKKAEDAAEQAGMKGCSESFS